LYTRSFLLVVLGLLVTASLTGQAVFGEITGTVTDPSGAVIAGAQVSAHDVDRGGDYTVDSNSSGKFTQTHLLPGHYSVTIKAAGFATYTVDAAVQVDSVTRVDAQMQISGSSQSVSVTGDAPLLKTDRADISTTLTANQLEKLPILDRNVTTLLVALPGAGLSPSLGSSSAENQERDQQTPVNGQLAYSNGFLLDGTENHSNILGLSVIVPNADALEEFKVTSSNYDARFGNASGAMMEASTKSGTNQFHGSAFEYLRNNFFNAADPFTGVNAPIRWNQFGGSLGNPILKNKLFTFFAYQGTRRNLSGSLITTVPTTAERSGDLTALLGPYICADGSTSTGGCANPAYVPTTEGTQIPARAGMIFDPATGNPDGSGRKAFSSHGQPNMITPAVPMTKLLNYLPLPNFGGPGQFFNNYLTTVPEISNADQYDGRVDYNITDKHHLFGRYSLASFVLSGPGAFGAEAGGPNPSIFSFAGDSHAQNQSLALGYTYSIRPSLIADFRFGFYRYRVHNVPNGFGTTPALDAGLLGLNRGGQDTSGMPAFYVNGDGGFNFGYALGVNGCNCPLDEAENQFQWVSNWTKQSGNHTIEWGADIRRAQQKRIDSSTHRAGEVTFSDSQTGSLDVDNLANGTATTGEGLASFLLGYPTSFVQQNTGPGLYPALRQTRLFFFGQDAWRATSKLTITYGLRYENYLPQVAAKPGSAGTFDPSTGEVVVAGFGNVPRNMGIKAYNLGFAPRIGVAYQATPTWVVRAGFGRSFNAAGVGAVWAQNPEIDPPVEFVQNLNPPNPYTTAIPTFLTSGPPPAAVPPFQSGRYPLPPGVSVYFFFDPLSSYRIPLSDAWNFAVQHQVVPTMTVEAAYVGNVGRHLFLNLNRNQAIPGPGDYDPRRPFYQYGDTQAIYSVCNCDNSDYNSLQLKIQKRLSHGLDFIVAYTWSKAIDNGEGGYNFADNYNVKGSHGPATFDRTNALTILNNWELPFGKGRKFLSNTNKVVDGVVGGWRFSGVSTLYSGVAFTPTISNAPSVNADLNYFQPDVIGNPSVPNPSASLWFDPSAYTAPQQPYRNGNAGKGSLRGPASYVFNLSLAKNFFITESKSLELRWENFNAFNHVNLGLPANQIDVAGAGQITSTASPMRQMQLGLHFRF